VTGRKGIHQFGPLRMQVWYCRLREREKDASPEQRYTLSNELRNFKTACGTRVGASVREYGTFLRDCLVCTRTDGAFNESIEGFWFGRLRPRGFCLHSFRQ
jgi:hypothetical protein